jgi:hypothetical protein
VSTKSPAATQTPATNAIPPELLQMLVNLNENEVIVPLRVMREDVHRIKAVKFSDAEVVKIQNLQDYLYDRGFLPDNTYTSLVVYMFNLTYTLHQKIAAEEAKKEAKV